MGAYSQNVERLLHWWPYVVEAASDEWSRSFARSIATQARRRKWRPSPKQVAIMGAMVDSLFASGRADDFEVLE